MASVYSCFIICYGAFPPPQHLDICLCLTPNNLGGGELLLISKSLKGKSMELNHSDGACAPKGWMCFLVMATTLKNVQLSVWAELHQNNPAIQQFPFSLWTSVYMAYVHSTGCGHFISYAAVEGSFRAQHLLSFVIFSIHVTHKFGDYLTMALGLMQSAFWTVFEGHAVVRISVNCQESL